MTTYPKVLPFIATVVAVSIVLFGTFLLDASEKEKFLIETRAEVLRHLSAFRTRLETGLNKRLFLTRSLTNYISAKPEITESEFYSLSRFLMDIDPGIEQIQLAPNNVIANIYPLDGHQEFLHINLLDVPEDKAPVQRAISSRQSVVTGPVRLGHEALLVFINRTPIFLSSTGDTLKTPQYWGLVQIVIDALRFFEEADLQTETLTMRYAIRGKDGLGSAGAVFFGDSRIFESDPITMDVSLPNGLWQVAAVPRGGWSNVPFTYGWFRVVGFVLAALFGALAWIFTRSPAKLRQIVSERTAELESSRQELQQAHHELERRVEERTRELVLSNEMLKKEIAERERAQEELRRSEENYRAIFENSPLGIFYFDRNGVIAACNENFEKIIGSSRERLIGLDMLHELRDQDIIRSVKGVLNGQESHYEGDYASVTAQKTTPVKCYFAPLLIPGSDPSIGGLGLVEDITERRLTEKARLESEERYRRLVELADDIIYQTDGNGCFTLVNSVALKITGYAPEELVGRHYLDLIHPEDREEAGRFYGLQYVKKIPVTYHECRAVRKDGRTLWVGQNVQLVLQDDTVMGFQSICRDITDRKKSEQALQQSEEKYRAIIQNIEEGYYEVDLAGTIEFCNDSLCRIFGYEKNELIGINYQLIVDEPNSQHLYATFNNVYRTGKTENAVGWEIVTRGGTRRLIEASVSLTLDSEGKRRGFRGICRDVSERKRTEELLLRSERLKAVGELASGVAHNFNNLLQILMGGAQLVRMNLDSGNLDSARNRIDQILESSRIGSETVRRLQSFARLRSDFTREGTVFDLSDTARNAIEMSKIWWKSGPEKSGLSITMTEVFQPGCMVSGRENELFEVVVNLLKNAVEAMPQGGAIVVETSVEASNVILKVKDTGIGISPEHVQRIFEPFFTTGGVHRTGMGLASSYGIVADHGGDISVASEIFKGATFVVKLPLAGISAKDSAQLEQEGSGSEFRILLIDDNENLLTLLKDGLTLFGQTVHVALAGEEGINTLLNCRVDIVISDLGMPGMSGWEVGKKVMAYCKGEGIPKIPFVVLTGWGDQLEEKAKIAESGVDAIVEKPVDINKLMGIVRSLVHIR